MCHKCLWTRMTQHKWQIERPFIPLWGIVLGVFSSSSSGALQVFIIPLSCPPSRSSSPISLHLVDRMSPPFLPRDLTCWLSFFSLIRSDIEMCGFSLNFSEH